MADHDHTPMQFTPLPDVDPTLNINDAAAVAKAKAHWDREQRVRIAEFQVLKDKLSWCYRREGVNHFKNCRYLVEQYYAMLDTMKDGWLKPFPMPERNQAVETDYFGIRGAPKSESGH